MDGMPSDVFYIRLRMPGYTAEQQAAGTGLFTVARATTPEGAGAVVAVLLKHPMQETDRVIVEVRKEI